MSRAALQACLEREQAHALAAFRLDEELATHHGLAWADFVLLQQLEGHAEPLAAARLAEALGLRRSRLLLRVLPLEKLGWLARQPGQGAVALTASGRRLLREASETAAATCEALAQAAPGH